MSADSCAYTLDISEYLFRLTTDSVRCHSNETKRYGTLAELVDARAARNPVLEKHSAKVLREHFTAIPTTGDIRINLTITRSSAASLDDAKCWLGEQLGASATLGDALSVLLLDYIADRRIREAMPATTAALDEARVARDELKVEHPSEGNVVPLR